MFEVSEQQLNISDLWLQFQRDKNRAIREKLIINYLSLVKLVAGRVAISLPHHVDRDDLVSSGFFGLVDAIERFDPLRGIKFETYAVARIRGAILDSLRAQDWVPASIRQKAKQYEQVLTRLETELGRSASDEEIANALGITTAELFNLISQLNATTVIPLEDFIHTETASKNSLNPHDSMEIAEVKQILARTIDRLPEKEKIVVTLYYYEGLTLKEISLILKLSEARISQLHTKAIFRMRGALARMKASLL